MIANAYRASHTLTLVLTATLLGLVPRRSHFIGETRSVTACGHRAHQGGSVVYILSRLLTCEWEVGREFEGPGLSPTL